jgi:hypothetical protein
MQMPGQVECNWVGKSVQLPTLEQGGRQQAAEGLARRQVAEARLAGNLSDT